MAAGIEIDFPRDVEQEIARALEKLPILERGTSLLKVVRRAAKVTQDRARAIAPKPGYPGDKPGLKALNKTITTVAREYDRSGGATYLAVVGPSWPDGAHGHLVEDGHRVIVSRGPRRGQPPESGKSFTDAQPFLESAAIETRSQVNSTIAVLVGKAIEELF